ncbi:hypothetical protein UlMin_014319 [Ulmus minor]
MEVDITKLDDVRWKPPDNGKLMINVDAATNNKNSSKGLGVMIRDSLGEFVLSKTIFWPFRISIEATEALEIKWGFFSALEAGLSGFSIASDCLTVVNALKSKDRALCEFGITLDEIFYLANCSNFEGFVFVPRYANKVAHCLARFVVLSNSSQVWKREIPSCGWSTMFADKPFPLY